MADADTKLVTLALSPRLARLVQFCIDREIECQEVPEAAETALTGVIDEIDLQAEGEPPFEFEDEMDDFVLPGASRPGWRPGMTPSLPTEAEQIADRMAKASRAAVEGE